MVRGIKGRPIFRDDRDRADFVSRLAAQAQAGAVTVYAWALLPNHAHLLVRTGRAPLAGAMRSLLTGYAGAFNRRHHRRGHLFQNRYRAFVAAGVAQGRRPDLVGGGLRRSAGGWEALAALPRGRERWAFDERVLGSGAFVERVLREAAPPPGGPGAAARDLPILVAQLAAAYGVHPDEIRGGSRRRPVSRARAAIATVAVTRLGLPAARVASLLGVGSVAIIQGIARGLQALHAHRLDPDRLAKGILKQVK
jgi:hypothetical protein